jgi:hypothetical protein
MPSLLSSSVLRKGGSGKFITLANAQPQLPESTGTSGYTIITDQFLQTRYSSTLGYVEFNQSVLKSMLPDGIVKIAETGSTTFSTSSESGTLVVEGGVGIGRNLWVKEDIHVNDILIGRGYEGLNNIVIRGVAAIPEEETNNGQENIVIGFSALEHIETAYANIVMGRYALSSGTNISNSIAIGDNALNQLGVVEKLPVASVTTITNSTTATVTTSLYHNLLSGTKIDITGVIGMEEITTQTFYINVISSSTFQLYTDNILTVPLDSTSFSSYSSTGTVNRILLRDNNIAIGSQSGKNLIDGQRNFFFGDQIARNFTTGSFNFFAGKGAVNLTHGNNIISINGSLIVDGVDNQVNLGSVFYYNGQGFATVNANTELGLGEESTSTTSGAVTVVGGLGVNGNAFIGNILSLTVTTSTPSTSTVGMFAVADVTNWDPAGKITGNPYPVFFDGSVWNALY